MADIILDLSGQGGVSDQFLGDADMTVAQPNLITNVPPSEMATGRFNPYLRKGYLAPVITSFSGDAQTFGNTLTSVVYDNVNNTAYWSEYGPKAYRQDGLADPSLTEVIDIGVGNIITDLEVYEKDSANNLYYTYLSDKVYLSTKTDFETPIFNYSVSVQGSGTSRPKVLASDSIGGRASFIDYEKTFVIPTGSANNAVVAFVSTFGTASININGTPMVLEETELFWSSNLNHNVYLFTLTGITPGTKTITVTLSDTDTTMFDFVALSGVNQTTPLSQITTQKAIDSKTFSYLDRGNNLTYLQFSFARDNRVNPASMNLEAVQFDPSTQTGVAGEYIFVAYTGSRHKFYIDGTSQVIYQYDHDRASWTPFPVYESKSLNVSAQAGGEIRSYRVSDNGLKLYLVGASSSNIYQYTMSTAFDISTATYDSALSISSDVGQAVSSVDLSIDGTQLYVACANYNTLPYGYIAQYELSTPFDITTATFTGKTLRTSDDLVNATGLSIDRYDSEIYLCTTGFRILRKYRFNKRYPLDISKAEFTGDSYSPGTNIVMGNTLDGYTYGRTTSSGTKFARYFQAVRIDSPPVLTPTETQLQRTVAVDSINRETALSFVDKDSRILDIGVVSIPEQYNDERNWLTEVQNITENTNSDYAFTRKADNGFLYLFAGHRVHKIDGGITGGADGTITRNVLLFPDYFTITDAVDFRSNMYIAVTMYPSSVATTDTTTNPGRAGVLVWNRISTTTNGTNFIELPGVREIKKIYASPDGMIKMITISENGLTELRRFGYNDSGGVVFPIKKTLGVNGYPQFPDSVTTVGDKTCWLSASGEVYCEMDSKTDVNRVSVTNILNVGSPIEPGAILFGSETDTASTGYRTNKQSLWVALNNISAQDKLVRYYPFDITSASNANQTVAGDPVYSGVTYVPITSVVRRVRVYNAPITGTGTDVVATVKLYFNQSKTAGMIKTITKDEAKRGYVDFSINKPYIHAVQLSFEWETAVPLGPDTYLPSVAVISTDDTRTKSPDNG